MYDVFCTRLRVVLVLAATAFPLFAAAGDCFVSASAEGYVISSEYSCPPGFYCPNIVVNNSNTLPQLCPPTFSCQRSRLKSNFCSRQGTYEPQLCPPGKYCPTFLEQYTCPSGHMCPFGSTAPTACGAFSICEEGAKYRIFYGAIVVVGILDAALVAVWLWRLVRHQWTRARVARQRRPDLAASSRETLVQKLRSDTESALHVDATDDAIPKADATARKLLDAFARANGAVSVRVDYSDVSYALPETGQIILHPTSGCIAAGSFTAIMGPSGAGKTTFVNALIGRLRGADGEVLVNGERCDFRHIRKLVGYVPQDDVMTTELTVRENLLYSARMRLPRWNSGDIEEHVNTVLACLGLENVANQPIGDEHSRGVSGGQRKRVNIGIELAACPALLVLDEPTSGLDASAALEVCSTLKRIASNGLTVIAVVHQPRAEIFEQFEKLIVFAKGGVPAYNGELREIAEVIGRVTNFQVTEYSNPADVLMDALQNQHASDSLALEYNSGEVARESGTSRAPEHASRDGARIGLEASIDARGASWLHQVVLVHHRSIMQQLRTPSSVALELVLAMIAGLLIGLSVIGFRGELYQGILVEPFSLISPAPKELYVPQMAVFAGMAVAIAGAPAGVRVFSNERPVFFREAAAGHSMSAYYVGKTIAAMYRFVVSSLHFTAVFYALSCPIASFNNVFVIILSAFFCVYGVAAVVSMLVRREDSALLAMVVGLTWSVLTGYGPTIKRARTMQPLGALLEISYGRWLAEAFYTLEVAPFSGIFETKSVSAQLFGYTLGRFNTDIGVAVAIGVFFRILAFLLMARLYHKRHT